MPVPPPAWNRPGDPFAEFISAEAIAARVAELGAQITRDYATHPGGDVVVIGVLKGSVIFLADLVRHIASPIHVDFIGTSSYGDATTSSGVVQITQDLSRPIEGKHVIIVEDIVDTGHTDHYLMETTGWVEDIDRVTWPQLKEIYDTGWTIGTSLSISHQPDQLTLGRPGG